MDGVLFSKHLTWAEIEAGLQHVLAAPEDVGRLELIVCRPAVNKRKVINTGVLDIGDGLVGDNWLTRGSSRTDDGRGHPDMQLTIMNHRFANLIAGSEHRIPLAGDQLFVDLDLSSENLSSGTHLSIGSAVIEVTSIPHLGCKKFVERFGLDALKLANSEIGRKHNLRGVNARVVQNGEIAAGQKITVVRIGQNP